MQINKWKSKAVSCIIVRTLSALFLSAISGLAFADNGCNFNIPALNFGIYNFTQQSPTDSSNLIQITCQTATSVTVKMGAGQSGSFDTRYMVDASNNKLDYNLFMDAQRSVLFGDGSSGTSYYNGVTVSATSASSMPIYGRLFKQQIIPPGSYFDSLTLDINF